MTDLLCIVLAAGDGTRMKSSKSKLLHEVAGRPMVHHVLQAAHDAGASQLAVVVAPERDELVKSVSGFSDSIEVFEQSERLGTAHAAKMAAPSWQQAKGYVTVVFGDSPLLRAQNFKAVIEKLDAGYDVAALGFKAVDPTGYGRFIVDGERLLDIREHKDATEQEREIDLCNGCILAFKADVFRALIDKVGNDNAQGEYYLPDLVALANKAGHKASYAIAPEQDVMGVNSRVQLAQAEAHLQTRLRTQAMENGVTLIDPHSTFLSFDTQFGTDVVVEPNVFFGTGVTVGNNVSIRASSHIDGATIGDGCQVGPFARLRPGAVLGIDAKVGNFCEVKKADIGDGAKVNHLSYIGDAIVGAGANIGAGTITCNYDGTNKHLTDIGENVFVGSNSSLVAPVKIGAGAYVASGSVVTQDVPADALALSRTKQENKMDYAPKLRARAAAFKKNKNKDQA